MKNLFLPLFAIALLVSCGGSEAGSDSENSSEETEEAFNPPDCPTSKITLTLNKWDSELDSVVFYDYSFDAAGSAGSYENNQLMFLFGDAANDSDMDKYDYLDACTYAVQITIDNPKVGEFDVKDGFAPVQPYVEGKSLNYFGSSVTFGDAETTGIINITELSEEWVCGSVDLTAFHGGVVKGEFSSKLRP